MGLHSEGPEGPRPTPMGATYSVDTTLLLLIPPHILAIIRTLLVYHTRHVGAERQEQVGNTSLTE